MRVDLLRELCETPGVPGREERLRAIVRRELGPLADEIRVDAMGNLIARKRGGGAGKLMIASHMDEIGFLVSYIDDKGFLRLQPLGGHDPRNMVGRRVMVCGATDMIGVLYPARKPPHLMDQAERDKAPKIEEFFVDLGLPVEAVREQVRVGAMVTMAPDWEEVGETVACKAMDNRLALYVMIEAVRRAGAHPMDVYAVATTQEEVGLRGATTSAFEVEPDVGVALDVTIAADLPGLDDHQRVTALGGGTAIKIMDSASISNPKIVEFLRALAERRQIPYQMEILPHGGTDAAALQRARQGAPAVTISTPCRYVHSPVEMVHRRDVEASIALLAAFLEEARPELFALD
jgi:putative aminopeptidase FrvX